MEPEYESWIRLEILIVSISLKSRSLISCYGGGARFFRSKSKSDFQIAQRLHVDLWYIHEPQVRIGSPP